MVRLILAVMLTIAVVSFSIGNSNTVDLSLVVGSSIKIRLIFLLYVTLVVGASIPVFYQLVTRARASPKRVGTPNIKKQRKSQRPPKRLGPAQS